MCKRWSNIALLNANLVNCSVSILVTCIPDQLKNETDLVTCNPGSVVKSDAAVCFSTVRVLGDAMFTRAWNKAVLIVTIAVIIIIIIVIDNNQRKIQQYFKVILTPLNVLQNCKWFEPRSHIIGQWIMIVPMSVVLRRTVNDEIERCFDDLSQSQIRV